MLLRPRIHLDGAPLHIVQRGHNRQPCFFADADYLAYLTLLPPGNGGFLVVQIDQPGGGAGRCAGHHGDLAGWEGVGEPSAQAIFARSLQRGLDHAICQQLRAALQANGQRQTEVSQNMGARMIAKCYSINSCLRNINKG